MWALNSWQNPSRCWEFWKYEQISEYIGCHHLLKPHRYGKWVVCRCKQLTTITAPNTNKGGYRVNTPWPFASFAVACQYHVNLIEGAMSLQYSLKFWGHDLCDIIPTRMQEIPSHFNISMCTAPPYAGPC